MKKISNLKLVNDGALSLAPSIDELRSRLARARVIARAWSETVPKAQRIALAAWFAQRSLEVCAQKSAPNLKLSTSSTQLLLHPDHAIDQLACSIGADSAALPTVEGLHFLTSLYPALLPTENRSELGAYYTPPALVERMFEQVTELGIDWRSAHILDPAAGGGAFLIPAALRIRKAMKDCGAAFTLGQIGTRLLGLEVDPNAARLAQGAIEIVLADLSKTSGRPIPEIVKVCDTLEEPSREAFDLVVGNPPYGRITLNASQRARFSRSLYGHANLYGVFTDIALRWTKANGLIAFLTPTSFLAGQYYSALRGLLADEAPPVAIDFVHARRGVFEDVLQETLLAVYKKCRVKTRTQIHYLHVTNECEAAVSRNGTIALPLDAAAPWLAPRSPEHSSLITHIESMHERLRDWGYSVLTGPLVWNRFKSQMRDKHGGKNVYPLIWAESVTSDGRFIFRAQKKNHAPYFKLENGDGWLLVEEPCVLVQRTTAKEQQRRLIAAELPKSFIRKYGGVIVENHLNMVRPIRREGVPSAVVAALLNSRAVDEVFRCMSGSVAVSAFELEALPLPHRKDLRVLMRLVAEGASREEIEIECNRLYGRD